MAANYGVGFSLPQMPFFVEANAGNCLGVGGLGGISIMLRID